MKKIITTFIAILSFAMFIEFTTTKCSAQCNNVLTPGVIGSDQSHCGPFKPAGLTSISDATANPGKSIVYQWLYSHVNVPNTPGNSYWQMLPGATYANFSPDSIFQTTFYIRCARTVECTFVGSTTESNIVTVTIHTNVTSSGTIGSDQSNCGPFKPATLTSIANATANSGETIEYLWLYSHVNVPNTVSNPYWHAILTAQSANYSPDSIFQTTYYTRCARTKGCTFVGANTESNIVTVTIYTNVTSAGTIGSDQSNCGPFKPATLTSVANATANSGETIEYLWLYSHVNVPNTVGNPYWHPIFTAQSANYSPDSIFQTTYYTRCARTKGCTFVGANTESNIVSVIIHNRETVDLGRDTIVSFCVGSIVLDAGHPGMHYKWSTGATTHTISVSASGTYKVTVTNSGNCTASDAITVTVNPNQISVNLGNDITKCAGQTATLDAGNTGMTYLWSTGATTKTIIASETGTYYVTVSDNGQCYSSDAIQVTILPDLKVNLGKDTTVAFCVGSLTLDAGNAGMNYNWNTGASTQTIQVTASGTYLVTVINQAGCFATDAITVTVQPGQFTVKLGNDTSFVTCHHETIMLNAGVTGSSYAWSTGSTSQSITVNNSGVYFVDVTNNLGCTASDTIKVTINDKSIDLDLGPDTTLCGCTTLNVSNPNATYYWCNGKDYPILNVCNTGMYCVEVRNGTCISSDTVTITIKPAPVVQLGNDITISSGSVTLNAGNPGASYLWSNGATTQMTSVTSSGTYAVTITDIYGCTASDEINVHVITGITENSTTSFPLVIYPNPSKDKGFTMNFVVPEKGKVEIKIINMLGLIVYTEKVEDFKGTYNKQITLQDYATGIYFVDVMKNSQHSTAKITLD